MGKTFLKNFNGVTQLKNCSTQLKKFLIYECFIKFQLEKKQKKGGK